MSIGSIVITGIVAVFLIFVILYLIFILMGAAFGQKKPKKQDVPPVKEKSEPVEDINPQDESHIAIISAVISEVLQKPVVVKNIYPGRNYGEDRTVTWRKSGWKGARGWRASSGW